MIIEIKDKKPVIGKNTYIYETAQIIGDVIIGDNCFVLPGAVIRGDINKITIDHHVNIQDNVVIHTTEDSTVEIGSRVSIGHRAIIHGAHIKSDCIIGMGAIVLDNVNIGKNCLIGAATLVTKDIPDNSLVIGLPGIPKPIPEKYIEAIQNNWKEYDRLRIKYIESFEQK